MPDLFDRRLTDPTADEVAGAFRAAITALNGKSKLGMSIYSVSELRAKVLGRRAVLEREGNYTDAQSPMRGILGRSSLVWWTNPAGRKLVRVRARRELVRRYPRPGADERSISIAQANDRHRRPGVWHLDPERVIEVTAGGEPEWVAVCGCGAAGSAESLGWHHGMCGPCADRVAEFGPEAVSHAPGVIADADFEPRDVLFTPDGKHVVAVGDDGYRVWDAATGEKCAQGDIQHFYRSVPPVCSPDGRVVFLDTSPAGLHALAFNGGRWKPVCAPSEDVIYAALWTGRPGELFVQTPCTGRLVNLGLDRAGGIEATYFLGFVCAIWPDPVAPRVVTTDEQGARVLRLNRDATMTPESEFQLGDGRLNRTGLWQNLPTVVRFTPDGERLLFVCGTEMELRHPAKPKALLQATFRQPVLDAAFAPDYEHLFVLGADGAVCVCNPGTLTSVRARLRWHVGPVSRLAVSPDGQTLATAGFEGVKLWPVGRLMSLVG